MSRVTIGLFTGLIIGLALALGGFGDALIVAFAGLVGWLVAKVLDGDIDLSEYLSGRRGGS